MFNTEPLSMVTPTARQESNGSASTSSFTSSSNNNNNNEIVGTFFKHEPREKWKKKNKFPVLFFEGARTIGEEDRGVGGVFGGVGDD